MRRSTGWTTQPATPSRPFAFLWRYVRRRPMAHDGDPVAVLGAVACSVSTQYGVKYPGRQSLSGTAPGSGIWLAFALLVSLIAADNLLWRVAGWIASYAFVAVTGDVRRDLFRHLTGHAPSYFADRLPGTLTSRITATSNAVFTVENMFDLERAAALRGDGRRDRLRRHRQPADGGRAGR